jgi:hypothetical protein
MHRQVQAAAPEVVPKTAGTLMTGGLGYLALCWDRNVMRSETETETQQLFVILKRLYILRIRKICP